MRREKKRREEKRREEKRREEKRREEKDKRREGRGQKTHLLFAVIKPKEAGSSQTTSSTKMGMSTYGVCSNGSRRGGGGREGKEHPPKWQHLQEVEEHPSNRKQQYPQEVEVEGEEHPSNKQKHPQHLNTGLLGNVCHPAPTSTTLCQPPPLSWRTSLHKHPFSTDARMLVKKHKQLQETIATVVLTPSIHLYKSGFERSAYM
jgi:hypothetical protein